MMYDVVSPAQWHDSIGDLMFREAMWNELGSRGIATRPATHASGAVPCLVPGGACIIPPGGCGIFDVALAPYLPKGEHALYGVAVVGAGDYGVLEDYPFVGVRDEMSWHRVKPYAKHAKMVPCVASLYPKPDLAYFRDLITYGWLNTALDRLTKYVIMDHNFPFEKPELDKSYGDGDYCMYQGEPHRVVYVDTRPWDKRATTPTFEHRNPDTLACACLGAEAVFCTSLHLSIMALAMETPFICWEAGRGKMHYYWKRAHNANEGCPLVFDSSKSEPPSLDEAYDMEGLSGLLRMEEQGRVERSLDEMVECIGISWNGGVTL